MTATALPPPSGHRPGTPPGAHGPAVTHLTSRFGTPPAGTGQGRFT